jgi:WD40 repeat protein
VFDLATGKLASTYRNHQGAVYAVSFTPDSAQLLTAGRDKSLHQWSKAEGKKEREASVQGDIFKVLLSGGHVFAAGSSGSVTQYDASDLKPIRTFEGNADWIYALAVDPVHQRVAAGSYDGMVTVWSLRDGSVVTRFMASPGCTPPR